MAILLKANGEESRIEPVNGKRFELEEIYALVGGYIEVIYLNESQVMVINEEGKLMNLPLNCNASKRAYEARALNLLDYIVGDAVICGTNQI